MRTIKIDVKFYVYQIIGVLVIWLGITFFLDKLDDVGRIIYYVVTSWLLLLIVLAIKQFRRDRKEKRDTKTK